MKRIGILGGTFDPPHLGHLTMAEYVYEEMGLDEVWFMPSYIPPHKEEASTDADKRVAMVERAISGHPDFRVCDIERKREGTSYTVDTMRDLKRLYPEVIFYFIIGGDMVEHLPKWNRIEELVDIVQFVGVNRPGYERSHEIPVEFVDIPSVDISSTVIRERVAAGKSIRYIVPESVTQYMKEYGLYETDS
ncbi:nicotinate-nucleotide adenylyltransferase [Bacillus sp. SB49]|uniref:nicotinate-nucleotide adenylyltransferase n=1 Tax=Bacillaceae TaxID=186817 RepID=UPI00041BE432|nr:MULTISPECIES: nicotinate-nucleotide adenylyltransferase [Bacillaceae]QHT47226.1 nicotinate-nucleotide adenylyltransferase [Bacillus sp. SB49]